MHRFAEMTNTVEHIKNIYQDIYFNGGGDGYPDYLHEREIITNHGKRYGRILNKYTVPGSLLDVGTAAGFILNGFEESGWCGLGLEPNLHMAEYGRSHLGLKIENGSLEQFSFDQQFDLVSMIQVIAHFFDIRKALQKAADVTKPGGYWLIETWDNESWIAKLSGRYWHEYSPPSVLNWFSPSRINHLAAQFGFSEVARGKPVKEINGEHVKSLIGNMLKNPLGGLLRAGLKIIPNHLVFRYHSIDLFWMLLQKKKELGLIFILLFLDTGVLFYL